MGETGRLEDSSGEAFGVKKGKVFADLRVVAELGAQKENVAADPVVAELQSGGEGEKRLQNFVDRKVTIRLTSRRKSR